MQICVEQLLPFAPQLLYVFASHAGFTSSDSIRFSSSKFSLRLLFIHLDFILYQIILAE